MTLTPYSWKVGERGGDKGHAKFDDKPMKGKKRRSGALTSKTLTMLLSVLLAGMMVGPTQHDMHGNINIDPSMKTLIESTLLKGITPKQVGDRVKKGVTLKVVNADDMLIHKRCGHYPFNKLCDACIKSRFTSRSGGRNEDPHDIEGADKGFVLGCDLYGPFAPDLNGNTFAMVVVEVGHTDYGFVELLKDKSSESCRDGLKRIMRDIKIATGPGGREVVRVHSDQDPSFVGGEFAEYLIEEQIWQTDTGAYRPQNNSRTERRIRALSEGVRANLICATGGIEHYDTLWGSALTYANHRCNTQVWSDGRCPWEALHGAAYVNDHHDNVYGAAGVYYVPKEHRESKLTNPGRDCIWISRSTETPDSDVIVPLTWDSDMNAYTLSTPQVATRVKVDNERFPLRMGPVGDTVVEPNLKAFLDKYNLPNYRLLKESDWSEYRTDEGCDPVMEVEEIQGKKYRGKKTQYLIKWKGESARTYEKLSHLTGCLQLVEEYESKLKHMKENKVKINSVVMEGGGGKKDNPNPNVQANNTNETQGGVKGLGNGNPNTDEEAVRSLIRQQRQSGSVEEWLPGYRSELKEVRRRRLKPLSDDFVTKFDIRSKAIRLRMNLEPKRDGRLKARLILQGFREPTSWDGGVTDSPVAAQATIRTLLFKKGDDADVISSIDVMTAFLQATPYDPNDEPRYVCYKPYPGGEVEYYQLLGPIYGQRSASLRFYKTLVSWLEKEGFQPGLDEPCLFVNHNTGITVVAWVDDLLVRGSQVETEKFYQSLGAEFDVKEPSYLTPHSKLSFVGLDMQVKRVDGHAIYSMNQNTSVDMLLDEMSVPYNTGIKCPMPTSKDLYIPSPELSEEKAKVYRSVIGTLNYLSVTTRYDISHTVSRLGQFTANPTESSYKAMYRLLQYLRSNCEFELEGQYVEEDDIQIYSDSDHAGDRPYTTKSQTGTMIMLNGTPVHWSSRKQTDSTAYSSALAEIYALSETVRAARLYVWRCEEMCMNVTWPLVVQVDNQQAISFQRGTCLQSRIRGVVSMREDWVQELRDANKISVLKVKGTQNPANILTKCMPNWKFQKELNLITGQQRAHKIANFMEKY